MGEKQDNHLIPPVETTEGGLKGFIAKTKRLLQEDLWTRDFSDEPWAKQQAYKHLRLLMSTGETIQRAQINEKAYGLTFISMLALIPGIAMVTAMFAGLGGRQLLDNTVRPLIMDNLVPSAGEQAYSYVENMVQNVNFGSLGVIGVLGVIYTVLNALKKIEMTFNDIMNSRRQRGKMEQFSRYWAMMTLGPILIGASVSIQGTVMGSEYVQDFLEVSIISNVVAFIVPIVMTCLAFTTLYWIMPSAHVSPLSAAYGGVIVGFIWEGAKRFYYAILSGSFQLNTIYGTLAVLPVTLTWIHITWIIVLIGAAVTYTHQNLRSLVEMRTKPDLCRKAREHLALFILYEVGRRFYVGEEPPTNQQIAEALRVSPNLIEESIAELEEGDFVRPTIDGDAEGYLPGQDMEHVRMGAVVKFLRERGDDEPTDSFLNASRDLMSLINGAETDFVAKFQNFSLRDLVHGASPASEPQPANAK